MNLVDAKALAQDSILFTTMPSIGPVLVLVGSVGSQDQILSRPRTTKTLVGMAPIINGAFSDISLTLWFGS